MSNLSGKLYCISKSIGPQKTGNFKTKTTKQKTPVPLPKCLQFRRYIDVFRTAAPKQAGLSPESLQTLNPHLYVKAISSQ